MFYSIWPRKYKRYTKSNKDKNLRINMFITVAGEPIEIISSTIQHAIRARNHYIKTVNPIHKPQIIVLNDGYVAKKDNWKEVRDLCKSLQVNHVARTIPGGFKAGNINNGLKRFPTSDPHNTIDCFFDSDFAAKKTFLTEIIKPLADDSVDFVQSPQRYKHLKTWVAKASAAHQIFFFDYVCPAKAHDNALFLCGTNYAIRREALLDVGGVDTGFITEDYATSIKLHLTGKRGVFVEKVLAKGLAPMTLKEYFTQQTRWSKGSFDTNRKFFRELFWGKLSFKQKFHYFLSATYYLIGVRDLILILAPIPYLLWGTSLIRANTLYYLGFIYIPLLISNLVLFIIMFNYPLKSIVLDIVSFPVFTMSFLSSLFKRDLGFIVTLKKYEKENPFKVYRIQLTVLLALAGSMIYSLTSRTTSLGSVINYFWALFDVILLTAGFILVVKENFSINISVATDSLEKLTNTRYGTKIANIATVMIATIVVSLTVPPLFNVLDNSPLIIEKIVNAKDSVVNILVTKEVLVPEQGTYYGYYKPDLNSHPSNPDVQMTSDDAPSLAMYYQDFNVNAKFNTTFMNQLSSKGVIPVITWEPFDTVDLSSEINTNGKPQELIIQGVYDQYLREWAQSARKYKKPFFLRFAHEMNGNWYPWGGVTSHSAEDYKTMWKHVYTIFEEEGATNVLWVWSPNNTDQYGVTETIHNYYPGDEYVDWVAYSAFNWGDENQNGYRWDSFETMSLRIYAELSKLNKPIMIAEMSSVPDEGNAKSAWFNRALTYTIPSMKNIKAVILFDQNDDTAEFSLNSGMDKQKMIKSTILNNDYYLKEVLYN